MSAPAIIAIAVLCSLAAVVLLLFSTGNLGA